MRNRGIIGLSLVAVAASFAWADDATVTFSLLRDKITIPVSLNGVGPYPFILDLGVPRPVIGNDVADYLKLEPDGGTAAQRSVHVDRVDLDKLTATMQTFVVTDLAPFVPLLGVPVAGIISPRGIADEFELDFDAKTLTLRGKGDTTIRGEQDPHVVQCHLTEQGLLTVNALVDGSHMRRLVVDAALGAVVSIPEQALAADGLLNAATPRLAVERPSQGTPEPSGHTQIRLKSIRLGGAEMLEPVCAIGAAGDEPRLGLGFLRHFRVTCDVERGLLRLEPSAAGPLLDPPILGSGITLGRLNEGYWTIWVAHGSPAAAAGLLSGSTLLEVGGNDLRDLPYADVTAKLGGTEGSTINIAVLQGGERRIAPLAIAKLL